MSVIIITGEITSGKSYFLDYLSKKLKKFWKVTGFISVSDKREKKSKTISNVYSIREVNRDIKLPWAIRNKANTGYDFIEETKRAVESEVLYEVQNGAEVVVMDDIGNLEMNGKGFDELIKNLYSNKKLLMIFTVKKELIEAFIKRYKIDDYKIIDLDILEFNEAKKEISNLLKLSDSEKIGIYSSVSGLTEVGLGSALHGFRVPLKGHFLAYLQNFLLILFGKELKGRGLYSISLITAALKSFSPVGAKLKPMAYIFIQGAAFALPTSIFGWNYFSVILGSMLTATMTLILSLLADYITFGSSVIETYVKISNKGFEFFHLSNFNFWNFLAIILSIKIVLAFILANFAYRYDFSKFLQNKESLLGKSKSENCDDNLQKPSFKLSLKFSLLDLFSKQFLIPFILISLLMFFILQISHKDFAILIIRGILVSWFGFLVARRIDFDKLIHVLEKRKLAHVALPLKKALATFARGNKNGNKVSSEK